MLSIRELAAQLAEGRTSSVQLVEEALARIDAHRSRGGAAYVSVDPKHALASARASDAARQAGYVPSLLAGLPVSIKDLFDVRGEVTTAGSVVLTDRAVANADAVAVARLRASGAILLGRNNMSEFGYSGLGLNPHYGTPVNPFASNRVAGGSTSGGAVSVARDMAAAALGTDTGGSIRIPSAFCGLTGFKPTKRRVPMDGAVPASRTLDTAGPLARTVDCCAIVDAVLSGDPLSDDTAPLTGLRLGVTDDYVASRLDNEVQAAFQRALRLLESAGASIQPFAFPELSDIPAINASGGLAAAEAAAWHRDLLASHAGRYDPRIAVRIQGGSRMKATDYIAVLEARERMIAVARMRLRRFDAWIMPTVATVAPEVEPLNASDTAFFEANALAVRNPSVINFLEGCALSIPCQPASSLPVGLSLCGLAGQDAEILAIGRAVEALLRSHSLGSPQERSAQDVAR